MMSLIVLYANTIYDPYTVIRPTLMGTKNFYENDLNPFLLFGTKNIVRPTLMGTKNLYENGPNPFFLFGAKNLVRPTLMGTKNLYENGPNPFFLTSLSLSRLCGGDTTMNLPNENGHQVFKTRRVRYARADWLELYSSTTLPVKRRHHVIGG